MPRPSSTISTRWSDGGRPARTRAARGAPREALCARRTRQATRPAGDDDPQGEGPRVRHGHRPGPGPQAAPPGERAALPAGRSAARRHGGASTPARADAGGRRATEDPILRVPPGARQAQGGPRERAPSLRGRHAREAAAAPARRREARRRAGTPRCSRGRGRARCSRSSGASRTATSPRRRRRLADGAAAAAAASGAPIARAPADLDGPPRRPGPARVAAARAPRSIAGPRRRSSSPGWARRRGTSGTVVHRWLQRIAEDALRGVGRARASAALAPRFATSSRWRGVLAADLDEATARASTRARAGAIADPRGRWVLGPHARARPSTASPPSSTARVARLVIDRVFTDETASAGSSTTRRARTRARSVGGVPRQRARPLRGPAAPLRRRALGGASRLGLYFPLIPGWREVES